MTSLLLALQLSAFSVPLSAFDAPDAATSAAVAVGLAIMDLASIEVAGPRPPAKAEPKNQDSEPIEWIRMCDPYGCRLVPRVPVPGDEEEATNAAEQRCWHVRRLLFGRWR